VLYVTARKERSNPLDAPLIKTPVWNVKSVKSVPASKKALFVTKEITNSLRAVVRPIPNPAKLRGAA
jgi:hypothetical protein